MSFNKGLFNRRLKQGHAAIIAPQVEVDVQYSAATEAKNSIKNKFKMSFVIEHRDLLQLQQSILSLYYLCQN